jgi:hypothetical protein
MYQKLKVGYPDFSNKGLSNSPLPFDKSISKTLGVIHKKVSPANKRSQRTWRIERSAIREAFWGQACNIAICCHL